MSASANSGAERPLTPLQQRFVAEYLVDLNGAQAAIRAGYAPARANSWAAQLLSNPKLGKAVAEGRAEQLAAITHRGVVTVDRLVEELAGIAFTSLAEVVEWGPDHFRPVPSDELTPWQRSAVKKVSCKRRRLVNGKGEDAETWEIESWGIELNDKIRAIEVLGKRFGLTPDEERGGLTINGDGAQVLILEGVPKLAPPPAQIANGNGNGNGHAH